MGLSLLLLNRNIFIADYLVVKKKVVLGCCENKPTWQWVDELFLSVTYTW